MKTFKARCTPLQGGYIDPDIVEIYNVEDPDEVYQAGHNQFRVNQTLTEEDFYVEDYYHDGEIYLVAFRR